MEAPGFPAIVIGAGLSSAACLSPASPGAQVVPVATSQEGAVPPCRPAAGGSARLILRRAYQEDAVFRPLESSMLLDGRLVFSSAEESRLRSEEEVVFDGAVAPGRHELTGVHRLRGHGDGSDSYLRNYRFTLPSKHTFDVRAAGVTCVTVVLHFRQDEDLPLEERPAVRHDQAWGGVPEAAGQEATR